MDLNEIDLKTTGIFFFDMLNGYYHGLNEAAKARKKPMIDNAVRIMKAGREAGMPFYFAQGSYRRDSTVAACLLTDTNIALKPWPNGIVTKEEPYVVGGEPSSDVIPELDPRPQDYYFPKYRWSSFYQTYLDLALRTRGTNTIIISGGSTDVGVASTVFAGRDLDYNMIIVRDACATMHDQRAHDVLMDLIFPRMARVRTTSDVVQMIQDAVNRVKRS